MSPLSETGRQQMVVHGWTLRRTAERFGVSVTTVKRWADRYRAGGKDAMVDRSSRPWSSPRRTPGRVERRVVGLRVTHR